VIKLLLAVKDFASPLWFCLEIFEIFREIC